MVEIGIVREISPRKGTDDHCNMVSTALRQDGDRTMTCPTCGSPNPTLHPSMQLDSGEVQICLNPWHNSAPTSAGERTLQDSLDNLHEAIEGAKKSSRFLNGYSQFTPMRAGEAQSEPRTHVYIDLDEYQSGPDCEAASPAVPPPLKDQKCSHGLLPEWCDQCTVQKKYAWSKKVWAEVVKSDLFDFFKHQPTGRKILNLLANGDISCGKAAEAIVESFELGLEPKLPDLDAGVMPEIPGAAPSGERLSAEQFWEEYFKYPRTVLEKNQKRIFCEFAEAFRDASEWNLHQMCDRLGSRS
jgi:hypothetical protein